MNSSGIKRGIAASAVAALAITGIGFVAGSASAAPGDTQLLTTDSGVASVVNDGVNTTVHLVASANDGGVTTVQFAWSNDGGTTWNNIGSPAVEANGVFSAEWAPPTSIYNTTVDVRAQGLGSVNTPVGTPDINSVQVSASDDAVNISTPAGTAAAPSVGVYQLPSGGSYHGIISGTASANGAIALANAGGVPTNADNVSPAVGGTRTFSGVVDFGGLPAFADPNSTPPNPNYTTVTATDDSDDAARVSLYKQTITGIDADNNAPSIPAGTTGKVTFTVKDQNGKPVAGARVYSANNADGGATNAGGVYFKTTNSLGQVSYSNLAGSSAGTAYNYWVNVGGGIGYDPGTDYQRTVTVTTYAQTQSTLELASVDGDAFDRDEFAAGDLSATLKDQNGAPVQGQLVNYAWTGTNFATPPAATTPSSGTATTNAQGKINVPLPAAQDGTWTLNAWVEKDGNPGEGAGDLQATAKTLKIGQAKVVWNDGTRISVTQGTTAAFTGSLQLADGTKLPGRSGVLNFTKVGTGDAVFAAQAEQPAGITRGSDTTATFTADATTGDFTVKIADPSGTIATKSDFGDVLGGSGSNIGINADTNLETDFMDTVVASITDSGTTSHNIATHNTPQPGVPQRINTIHVQNAATQPLVGVPVTIAVDHGYLTSDDGSLLDETSLTPAGQANGGLVGNWEDLGKSVTIKTDDNGNVEKQIAAAMGHDDAFADGTVKTTIAISGGGKSVATAPTVVWNQNTPLNVDALTLAFSDPSQQDSSVLPLARGEDQNVYLDEVLTDQFGNVITQANNLLDDPTDDTNLSDVYENGGSQLEAEADFPVTDHDQTVSVTSDFNTITWKEDTTVTPHTWSIVTTADAKTVDATAPAISWYALSLDPTQSSFTVTHSPAGSVQTGTTVFVTYTAIDQHTQPINNAPVAFVRTGPDALQDGDIHTTFTTDANGQATYAFQGAKAGVATISGMLGFPSGPVQSTVAYDTVTFTGSSVTPPAPKAIKVKLTAKNAGNGDDKLAIATNKKAKGAKVTIYKVVKGKLKKIGTAKIGRKGKASKRIADHTKRQMKAKTTYVVKVAKTKATKAATSNKKTIK